MPPLTARPDEIEDRPSAVTARSLHPLSTVASALLHAVILAVLIGLLGPAPLPDEPVVKVMLVTEGPGAAGAAGGAGGGAGTAPEAASAPAAPKTPSAETAPAKTETPPTPPKPEAPPQPTASVATAAPAPATEPLPPPPRRKPRPPRHHPAAIAAPPPPPAPPQAQPQPPALPTPPQPPRLAAAATPTPTPGAPGAGSGPGGKAGVGTGTEGAGHGAIGDGPIEGPGDDYLERLRRWLSKYKHYPPAALKQKQEGGLIVSFTVLRDGTVVNPSIAHSSGFPLLDQAALKMLRDASPVPPLPPTYRATRADISLPVDFSIGFFDKLFGG